MIKAGLVLKTLFYSLSFQNRATLILGLAVFVIAGTAAVLSISISVCTLNHNIERETLDIAKLLAEGSAQRWENTEEALICLGTEALEREEPHLKEKIDYFFGQALLQSVEVYDMQGEILFSFHTDSSLTEEKQQLFVSFAEIDETTTVTIDEENQRVFIVTPIYADEKIQAVAIGEVDVLQIPVIQGLPRLGEGSWQAAVLDEYGTPIISTYPDSPEEWDEFVYTKKSGEKVVLSELDQNFNEAVYFESDGVVHIATIRQLAVNGHRLLISRPRTDLSYMFRELQIKQLMIFMTSIVILIASINFVASRVGTGLREAVYYAQNISGLLAPDKPQLTRKNNEIVWLMEILFDIYKRVDEHRLVVIEALVSVVEAKDSYTAGHSKRVMELSKGVAKELDLEEETVDKLCHIGILHDIGKLAIPDNILRKPGSLSPGEWEIVQKHPVASEKILYNIGFITELLPAIRAHHEHWDGTGYPDGLKGSEIPYLAQIVHLADAFDAMTSNRPYRKAMGEDEALNEIAASAGRQFNPVIVEAFLRRMRRVT